MNFKGLSYLLERRKFLWKIQLKNPGQPMV